MKHKDVRLVIAGMRTPTRDDRRPRNHLEHLVTPAVFCGPAEKTPLCPSRPSPKGARPEAPRMIYGQASSVSPTEPSRASASDVRPRTVRQRSHRCIPTGSGCLSPTRRSDRSSSATNYAGKAPPFDNWPCAISEPPGRGIRHPDECTPSPSQPSRSQADGRCALLRHKKRAPRGTPFSTQLSVPTA
jgi:hypothetical protein